MSGPDIQRAARQADEVLRYWHALLRHQDALAARPRARRNPGRAWVAPNLVEPARGQDYVKLDWAGAERFLVEQVGAVRAELGAQGVAFFEHWLATHYRAGEDDGHMAHLVLFPTLQLPREELGGVLRFPVALEWKAADRAFKPPSHAERRSGQLPEAPSHFELSAVPADPDAGLPFFLDLKLLRDTLRVPSEELEARLAQFRRQSQVTPSQMLRSVCELIETPLDAAGSGPPASAGAGADPAASAGAGADPARVLARLHAAVAQRLARLSSRSRAYPVALVVAADRTRVTWHVQRDIDEARGRLEDADFQRDSPLWPYLTARAALPERRLCLGRWPRAPLTASQRSAIELALGSRLAAVQGPPGTGKTTLILNAVVHQLIEKVRAFADSDVMGEGYVLVTSTNNRAVDNVVDALAADEASGCPLALRIGNRDVMERTTVRELSRVRAWLAGEPTLARSADLEATKREFSEQLRQLEAACGPQLQAHRDEASLAALRAEQQALSGQGSTLASVRNAEEAAAGALRALLARLGRASPEGSAATPVADAGDAVRPPWEENPERALENVEPILRGLERLSRECEEASGAAAARIQARYRRLQRRLSGKALHWLGAGLELPAAPERTEALEAWEEVIEHAIGELAELRQALQTLSQRQRERRAFQGLEERIAELSKALRPASAAGQGEDEPELRRGFERLYQLACQLRLEWARRHREPLLHSLESAAHQCQKQRSLRGLLDSPKGAGVWLRQLFPGFGCTLLSLGNALPPEPQRGARVIVDEAGQCQPAYAVSALLRGRSALVIGDVHQLEPVVGLGPDDERRIRKNLRLTLDEQHCGPYLTHDESGNSAQSLADRAVRERPTLRDHFRCQPGIVALSEAWCAYGMVVRTPPASRAQQLPALTGSVLFQSVAGEQERQGGSWLNAGELTQVVVWVRELLRHGIEAREIGVISPFRGQSEALFRALRAEGVPLESGIEGAGEADELDARSARESGVAVGTVHRFQGGERSVVLLSTTVTRSESLGFLDQRVNLLNVAVTRAREHLLILGHERTLLAGRHTPVLVRSSTRC